MTITEVVRGTRRFALGGMAVGAVCEMIRPNYASAQERKEIDPASAHVLDQLRTRFTFQISVDVYRRNPKGFDYL